MKRETKEENSSGDDAPAAMSVAPAISEGMLYSFAITFKAGTNRSSVTGYSRHQSRVSVRIHAIMQDIHHQKTFWKEKSIWHPVLTYSLTPERDSSDEYQNNPIPDRSCFIVIVCHLPHSSDKSRYCKSFAFFFRLVQSVLPPSFAASLFR